MALYRAGRQVEALEVLREARRSLADELGLEPSPRLQELERAILQHDPAVAAPRRPAPVVVLAAPQRSIMLAQLGESGLRRADRPRRAARRRAAVASCS